MRNPWKIFKTGKVLANSPQITTIPPQIHHQKTTFCHPFFPKPPAKTRKSPPGKNCSNQTLLVALLVRGPSLFWNEFRGESQVVLVAGRNEVAEDGVRLQRLGLEFRMKLAAEKEWMGRYFNDFHVGCIGSSPGDPQPPTREDSLVLAVELISMAVALADLRGPIGLRGQRPRF